MALGFMNGVLVGPNADFHTTNPFQANINNGLITNGDLWIGSTALNAGGTHINVGTLTSPNGSIAIGYSSPNITLETVAKDDLHVARYIVSPGGAADGANYTTIASAYAAAVAAGAPQTVFIQPGTYTENITLTPGINLTAFVCDATTPNVIINGKLTLTAAGTVSISGIQLQTNSDYALAVTGSAASIVDLINCFISATNHTAIQLSSSSGSSLLNLYQCNGDVSGTGIANYSVTGAGIIFVWGGFYKNTGGSTTADSVSSGTLEFESCYSNLPISASATGNFASNYAKIDTSFVNTTCLTVTSSTTSTNNYLALTGGTASALSIGMGSIVEVSNLVVNSSNTHAITGAGTIEYGLIVYNGSSSTNNVSTQTALPTQPAFPAPFTDCYFQAYLSSPQTINAAATTTVVFDSTTANQGSGYNTATGVFTAPATGFYSFASQIFFTLQVTGAQTDAVVAYTGSVQSSRLLQLASAAADNAGISLIVGVAWSMPMTAGDTVEIQTFAAGTGTYTAFGEAISAAPLSSFSTFSGFRVF